MNNELYDIIKDNIKFLTIEEKGDTFYGTIIDKEDKVFEFNRDINDIRKYLSIHHKISNNKNIIFKKVFEKLLIITYLRDKVYPLNDVINSQVTDELHEHTYFVTYYKQYLEYNKIIKFCTKCCKIKIKDNLSEGYIAMSIYDELHKIYPSYNVVLINFWKIE